MNDDFDYLKSTVPTDAQIEANELKEREEQEKAYSGKLTKQNIVVKIIAAIVYVLAGIIWILNGVNSERKMYIVLGILFLVCGVLYVIPIIRDHKKFRN
ncbi:MAG: hypothetical protein K6D96_08235 [Acetatifactor sp.]|nr:hypothetical protein [Acetatifactor sp.]